MIEHKVNIYDLFSCIGAECTKTCCTGWKISVDKKTGAIWRSRTFQKEYGKGSDCLSRKDGELVVALREEKDCFLLNNQLCSLIVDGHGDWMPKTCRDFPRLFIQGNHEVECHLMPSCPVVVDLLFAQERIALTGGISQPYEDLRNQVIKVVNNPKRTNQEVLKAAFYLLLEDFEKGERQVFSEDLEPLYQEMGRLAHNCGDSYQERNELFLDMAVNYQRENRYPEYLNHLTELGERLTREDFIRTQQGFEEALAPFDKGLRNYLLAVILGNLSHPSFSKKDLVVSFQWIGLVYACILHGLYLDWMLEQKLTFEQVKETIVVLSRMTGYNHDDIKDFLKNEFESLVWDWGYFALVVNLSGN